MQVHIILTIHHRSILKRSTPPHVDKRAQAASKKKRKEERAGERDDEPQQQSAAVLARGRLGHAVRDWFSPRLMVAGGGLFMSLSRWGILPSVCPASGADVPGH